MFGAVVVSMLFSAAQPQAYALFTPLNTWDVAVEDLTGNGMKDIVALCSDEESYPLRKHLAVFLARDDGGYDSHPAFLHELEPEDGALFWAETDGAPPRELVVTRASGARVYGYADGAFRLLRETAFHALLPSGSREPRFLRDAAADLTGNGIDEWFIPVAAGFEIRTMDGLVCAVDCDVFSEIRSGDSMYIVHRLPAYHPFDVEGQEHKGLAFLSDEFADFAYGPNWSERRRFRIPVNLEEKWEASAQMKDINGNGLPDLVVTQTQGTVNMKVLTQVYMASGPFTYPDEPTATFEASGSIASPILIDVDGDGRLDLILAKIPFGVRAIVNFFLKRTLGIQVEVYLFDGERFSSTPDFRTSLSVDAPDGRERAAYTMGDFNGDGRLDVALGVRADRLEIRTGSADRFLSPRPWVTFDIPTFGAARPYDLNANGADDLIIFHPGGAHKRRIEVILF